MSYHIPASLQWLSDPARMLVYHDEFGHYHLTVLGKKATRAVVPLSLATGIAQLVRDLLTLDEHDAFMAQWSALDHLLLLTLLHTRTPTLRPYSNQLVELVDAWMEKHPTHISLLYREWIRGAIGGSRAHEVLGSLGITLHHPTINSEEQARRHAYQALFLAIVLFERSQGRNIQEVIRQFGVKSLEGVEERWRDEVLWLLSGIARLLDMRAFYYHLRESCTADQDRMHRVKRRFLRMRHQCWSLAEAIKYCSPLGSFLLSLRRTHKSTSGTVNIDTIRHLEASGIRTVAQLKTLSPQQLVTYGIRRDLAQQIHTYLRQRSQ